jgi:hypothetical protein
MNDQHIAVFGPAERLQEHVHAAVVPRRQCATRDPLVRE